MDAPRAKKKQQGSGKAAENGQVGRKRKSEEDDALPPCSQKKKSRVVIRPSDEEKKHRGANAITHKKPTNSDDFFKRKDFVTQYFSATWTFEKKASKEKEKTLASEEGTHQHLCFPPSAHFHDIPPGCVSIEWDKVTLMNMNGKPVGTTQLVRRETKGEETDTEMERVFLIKGKKEVEILLEPGQHFMVGTKQVQVHPSYMIAVGDRTPGALTLSLLTSSLNHCQQKSLRTGPFS